MEEQQKKSLFDLLTPKQNFVLGLVGGLLVLIVIGFFVLLGMVLSGSSFGGSGSYKPTVNTNPTSAPTNETGAIDVNLVAESLKLDMKDFSACLTDPKTAALVEADQASGDKAGVRGTPHTIALLANGTGAVLNGAIPFEQADALIAGLLKGEGASAMTGVDPVSKDDHIIGAKKPKVTLIEYSDFECPFCQRFHPTTKQILAKYPNDVALVYRHFPLESIHQNAKGYAVASECAAQQDKFWEFADAIFGA